MAPDAAASTASRSNVRDDRDTPLMWDGMAIMYHRFYFGKTEIFFRSGLDRAETQADADLPVGQNQLGFSIVIPGCAFGRQLPT
jgi:hypothetical protein